MDLVTKLQLKSGQGAEVHGAPTSVSDLVSDLAPPSAKPKSALLVFAINRAALEKQRRRIVNAVNEDRLTWVLYPKAGQLDTDLNRDSLAALLNDSGLQPVRQIAFDEVWSALRFRLDA